jgi:predicted transcriptional regulator of viral defense system
MSLHDFFATRPVFTADELAVFLKRRGSHSRWTRKSLLVHHEEQGHVLRLRRGLYAAVPAGVKPSEAPVDPYLLASKLAGDSVLAYHTALAFHGNAYSVHRRFTYLTATTPRLFRFRGEEFLAVKFPKALRDAGQATAEVADAERQGLSVRVTTLERTLVDALDRPELCGGWEETWRSLESVEFFDLDRVVRYTLLLSNATTTAKVGYFLQQHRKALMVEESHLARLREHRPKEPHYTNRRSGSGKFLADWNLVVPREVAEQSWEAVR